MTPSSAPAQVRAARSVALGPVLRRNAWSIGLVGFLVILLGFTKVIQPNYGAPGLQGLASAVLPLALATVAQAIVVIAGGLDLSIASQMALVTVVSARLMDGQSDQFGILIVALALGLGMLLGLINGGLVVITRVPDIVVTLAMSYVWSGAALLVLENPGGSSPPWLNGLVTGFVGVNVIPKAFVVMLVVVCLIWIPLRRSRIGLSLFAVGSNQLAAFRSGISVSRTKLIAYVLTGLFSALAGLSVVASTTIGDPKPGPYTLQAVAAIVLGGVSLAGGRGGVFGPIVAVMILQLIRTDMTLMDVNNNLATVLQGVILIGVVMIGSLIQLRRARS